MVSGALSPGPVRSLTGPLSDGTQGDLLSLPANPRVSVQGSDRDPQARGHWLVISRKPSGCEQAPAPGSWEAPGNTSGCWPQSQSLQAPPLSLGGPRPSLLRDVVADLTWAPASRKLGLVPSLGKELRSLG